MRMDHDRLENMFGRYKAPNPAGMDRVRRLFLDFETALQMHIVWEEDILFPVFEQETGMHDAGPTAVMRMEHRHIKKLLEQIDEKLLAGELSGIENAEIELLDILESHNQKEENILYPAIDNLTTEREKKQAVTYMAEMRSAILA
jgi:iron-sulfur cluster repair protein YtfE (RIC family)